mmetsp:Transcript_107329/g.189804  ORF Transcript_107329/g.189804 Transcript_107329/m.189804 type:complete len:110 (+) Transcript_107329:852-1181(+)
MSAWSRLCLAIFTGSVSRGVRVDCRFEVYNEDRGNVSQTSYAMTSCDSVRFRSQTFLQLQESTCMDYKRFACKGMCMIGPLLFYCFAIFCVKQVSQCMYRLSKYYVNQL